jgi:hypothetical protein
MTVIDLAYTPIASWSAPTMHARAPCSRKSTGPFYLNAAPILYVSRRTAELIKYASNAFLATKITFINGMADLCEQVGADVQDVARGMGLDNRIGAKFLHAGPRLRRLVSAEGYRCADQDGARSRRPVAAWSKPSAQSTTSASAPWRARSFPRSTVRFAGSGAGYKSPNGSPGDPDAGGDAADRLRFRRDSSILTPLLSALSQEPRHHLVDELDAGGHRTGL